MTPRSLYKEVIVNPAARRGHRTITDAIKAVKSNCSIRVRAGVYRESLIIRDTIFDIEIIGDGQLGAVTIEGGIYTNTRNNVFIHNLIFKPVGAKGYPGAALIDCAAGELAAGLVMLKDCDITNPISTGVRVHGNGAELELYSSSIHDCAGDGLYIEDYGSLKMGDCKIYRNNRYGINCQDNSQIYLFNCEIRDNRQEGLLVNPIGYAYLAGCRSLDNGGKGAWVISSHARVLGENNQPPIPSFSELNSSLQVQLAEPLQTDWRKRGTSYYIKIDRDLIWIGPTNLSNDYHCTLAEFYRGSFNEVVRDSFGHKTLNEVLAVVTKILNKQERKD